MADIISDAEIAQLVAEPKILPVDYRKLLNLRAARGHRHAGLDIRGENGSEFRILLRQAAIDSLNFSAILAYLRRDTGSLFRLRRYNGLWTEHRNHLENGPRFLNYHIHQATERYQRAGYEEDGYAEETDRYTDLSGPLRCMIEDCSIHEPPGDQIEIFEWGFS